MDFTQDFNLEAFLDGIERDKTKVKDPTAKLNKVLMNNQDNQGVVSFVPFLSNAYNNFYIKIPRVMEFYGATTMLNSGEGWMKFLPLDMYGKLTQEETDLYFEIKKLFDELFDSDELGYDELRMRTYSLFTGVQVSHKSDKNGNIDELNDCACLYVFPSASPIDSLSTAIQSKMDLMKGNRAWLSALFSPATTGRKAVMQISFKKSAGAGYDANVAFEFNSELQIIVDPEREFEPELIKNFDDALALFLGWSYDRDNNRMFNMQYMKELRKNLIDRLNSLNSGDALPTPKDAETAIENRNMSAPTGATQEVPPTEPAKTASGKTAPF